MFKFDLLFEIQVPRPWDEGKERNKFHEVIEQTVLAEAMGFEAIWLVEHHFLREFAHSSAPEVMLGALAMRTSRIRLGHGVVLLPQPINHPIRVAERAATIDILSDGRLEMGTGRSSSPYQIEPFGVEMATTREQWEESIKLLPRLWSEDNLTYEGQFWSWKDQVTVLPRPLQRPHPPLWVASAQPDTCRLAGEKGIGLLLPAIAPPETFSQHVKAYKDAVAQPLDQIGEFKNDQAGLFTIALCHDDDEYARNLGGPAGLWYLNTVSEIYKNDWRGVPLEEVPPSHRYHAEMKQKGRAADVATGVTIAGRRQEDAMWKELIDVGAFCIGSPDRIIEKVQAYRKAGADRLVSIMQIADVPHETLMRSIELFGTKVIPHFRALEAEQAERS